VTVSLSEARDRAAAASGLPPIVGDSRALRDAVSLAQRTAESRLPVLLVAPTGCGKELFAHHIHRWSGRPGELVDVNCAALPESLIESELFGHGAEAFTGARRAKPGLIEVANGKSFLLDEIPSLSLALQAKLLRVIEAQELRRVGELAKRPIDVRFIAAAQDDLSARVLARVFREDLFHRLAGVIIQIPPLAERPEDVLPLARHFANCLSLALETAAERALLEHEWPGNVRELRMVIERSACLTEGGIVTERIVNAALAAGTMAGIRASHGTTNPDRIVANARRRAGIMGPPAADDWGARSSLRGDRSALASSVERCGGNIAKAARSLGVPRTTLLRWLREVGLVRTERPGRRTERGVAASIEWTP
jgi:transcriptional regulator with GAF, ATPase, and Fis domain